ncbi:hypothetical protein BDZ97DRAFT_1913112 [Flammula alnicola]|nr:hypothetical protein BDZ97DRAFT_1913112 [Flammula alnicola]
MSDPAAVMSVYSSIIDDECNWLLLHYINESGDELGLHSYGKDGLEELKTKLSDYEVFIAFYREEIDLKPGYIIINYIPPSISGVKRARALIHSRRVGAILKKHQTIFTVDSLSLLTVDKIHQVITNPDTALPNRSDSPSQHLADATNRSSEEERNISTFNPTQPLPPLQPVRASNIKNATPPKAIVHDMARRSFTATYAPGIQPPNIPPVPPLPKGGSLFTSLLRRRKKTDDPLDDMEGALPPPTPPKDKGLFNVQPIALSHSSPAGPSTKYGNLHHQRSRSWSDFAVISHVRGSDEVIIEPDRDEPLHSYTIQPRGKWSLEIPRDPVERARQRRELQLQREREDQAALIEEAERQRQLKMQKEEFERQEREEEVRRKAEVEQEIRRITAERRRREQLEREEDERKREELEERKRLDKERRLEEHRRLEEWRKEQAKKGEAAARQVAEAKRREEAERQKKIQQAEAKVKRTKEESELTGWITIQSKDCLSWKRRFYKFVGSTVFIYRSSKDLTTVLEKVDLRGKVRGLKEWNQGYDDLEAIAFSFVVEFKNGQDPWSMFADSEEEKYKVLGLFKIAAGL